MRQACCLQLARKDGATPLHEAAAAGHTEVAKVLMSVGATPDVTDVVSRPHQEPCTLCGQYSMHSVTHLSLQSTEAISSKLHKLYTGCTEEVHYFFLLCWMQHAILASRLQAHDNLLEARTVYLSCPAQQFMCLLLHPPTLGPTSFVSPGMSSCITLQVCSQLQLQ